VVRGGGENSIIIKGGSDISNVVVSRVNGVVSVKVQGDANVEIIYIDDGSDDVNVEGTVGSLEIHAPDVVVTAVGADVKTVNMSGGSSKIVIDKDSKVGTLNVREGAANAKVEVAGVVSGMTTAAPSTAVSGSGTVNKVEVKKGATGAKIETPKTEIVVGVGVEGVTGGGGAKIEGGESVTNDDSGTGINDGPVVLPPMGGGGGSSVPPTPVGVSAISVSPGTLTLTAGGATGTLTATVSPAGATNKNVTWASSNTSVATVAGGVVTPLTAGTTTITATTVDGGKTATTSVTVEAQTLAEAKTAAEGALAGFTATNATTEADVLAALDTTVGVRR